MKELKELLKSIDVLAIQGDTNRAVFSIEFDSRKVGRDPDSGTVLYVAQKGTLVDGHRFISDAIRNGAGVIVCEDMPAGTEDEVTYVQVPDSSVAMAGIAAAFYDYPSEHLKLVGITGTNGKTTTVTLLYRLLSAMGHKTGLISTIENRIDGRIIPSTHTTPDSVTLNRLLREMVNDGCEYCFMEVSSHAICQHRIDFLSFTVAVFSNITHDHLDFHKTFYHYIHAKKKFFDQLSPASCALINKDDKNGKVMVQSTPARVKTYSLNTAADFKGKILDNSFEGLQMIVNGKEVFFKLSGKFNAYNLLAIYGTAILLGLPEQDVLVHMSALDSAAGRFQMLANSDGSIAIIDYAHTPDALQNVLSTIKEITQNSREIITVVGSGGNRDSSKRPLMASVACRFSNKVILTSDNPRNELPSAILEDMEAGVPVEFRNKVLTIENRREAIKTACMLLEKGGVLLVAGKGHETYQEIEGVKYHFDDSEVVKGFFI